MKSTRAKAARPTFGAARPWITAGYATAHRERASPAVTHRHSSFCGDPNPSPLDQLLQAKHHHFDPQKQTPGGRHQIGTLVGFKSESVAGFKSESGGLCEVAGARVVQSGGLCEVAGARVVQCNLEGYVRSP
ncbi:MAG TPA: hypothetical protein VE820_07600, partial [Sphingomicrobium sp.]|nr:hypothetical protein [Sphingomicrobium sp.]